MQAQTGKATLGDAMLSIFQELPQAQWMITTLGRRGSVLLKRQLPQQGMRSVVLEDELADMLNRVAASDSRSQRPARDEPADCISSSGVPIRFV